MSHFAKIDKDGIVLQVIVAEQNFVNSSAVGDGFNWIQTSYNSNFRKQFAEIGYKYDKVNDVFILPCEWPSWTLDENFDWQPPVSRPADYYDFTEDGMPSKYYDWDEENQSWNLITL